MLRFSRLLIITLFLSLAVPGISQAQDTGGLSEWIDRTGIHRIAGYSAMGLALTTATLGAIGLDIHPIFGRITPIVAAATVVLGSIAYYDRISVIWPHMLLHGLATTGFTLNALVFEGGSPAHIASGIISIASMAGAFVAIRLITR